MIFRIKMWTFNSISFIKSIVENPERPIVGIIAAKLDFVLAASIGGAPTSKDAMTDLLKFAFNVLVHYPKVCNMFRELIALTLLLVR